jgi:hypothetical protein
MKKQSQKKSKIKNTKNGELITMKMLQSKAALPISLGLVVVTCVIIPTMIHLFLKNSDNNY